jgi:hypothetical protein
MHKSWPSILSSYRELAIVAHAFKSCETTNAGGWWKPIPELKGDKPLKQRWPTWIEKARTKAIGRQGW